MSHERLAISRWKFGDSTHGLRAIALGLWFVSACQLQSSVHSSTLLVVEVEIERAVRAQADRVSISAAQGTSAERAQHALPVYAEDFVLASVDDDRVLRVVLRPRGLATPFVSIHVSAESARRVAPVAEARLDTRYGAGEWRRARLRLSAACIDVSCEAGATCAEGACVSAAATWSELPLYWPNTDAGRTRERDASPPSDASAPSLDASIAVGPVLVDDSGIVTGLGQALSDDDAGMPFFDPCAREHGGCDARVSCTNVGGVAKCGACPAGFDDVQHDGTLCADIDECSSGRARCADHARCQNRPGDYRCVCESGYHDDGGRCAPDDMCGSDADCPAAASCKPGSEGARVCQCQAGYAGDAGACADIDECASGALHCGAGATCVNRPGGASCQCLLGYVLSGDSCVDVDECATGASDCDTSPAACVNTPGGFVCQCPAGFRGDGKGSNGCVGGNPCTVDNGGCDPHRDCLNTSPGPTCGDCMPGYQKNGPTGCVEVPRPAGRGGAGEGGRGSGRPGS